MSTSWVRGFSAVAGLAVAAFVALAGGSAQAQTGISIGGSRAGSLAQGDSTLNSGEFVDTYTFEGRAGQQVTVSMTSGAFDSYVMVRGPSGFSEDNDDRETGDTNSQLTMRLPSDGTYRIQATSFQSGETGAYRVSVVEGAGDAIMAEGGGSASVGTNSGQLRAGDQQLDAGEYMDRWTLTGTPGQRYVARLNASDFDAYLIIRGEGVEEDNDDDATGRGSTNSRIEFVMPADGDVTIAATSYQANETGTYQLLIEAPGQTQTAQADTVGSLRLGQSINGQLAQGDPTLSSGEFMNVYTFSGRAGQQIDLRLRSSAFDPYLFINGPNDFALANDDDDSGADGTNSRLIVTLPADGEYRVYATSYQAGEAGAYSLSAAQATGEAAAVATAASSGTPAFETGIDFGGDLSASDERLDNGKYADGYTFSGRRGERVSLTLESSAFDAYLMMIGPDDSLVENDDGVEGSTNSRIDVTLPADGDYTIGVTSYNAGETGAYRFTAGPSMGTPRQAGVQGGPRVFAVMVGISDYGGRGDLPYTAEDALKLAESLRRDGVLNPASVTLVDADATVAGVKNAIARVGAMAGPNDIFLFFYSGHGSQRASSVSAAEPDGKTETIVMRDGQISDAEMAQLFSGINARMSLIVLDSCFSGGFGRNVVVRPGVVGLFSSEEDLTSAVAGKFEAGGYLSHFLRTGLSGEANLDGDDMITAGELTTYLRRKFASDVQDVASETMDGQRSYQNLVVERGGVQVDDVVMRVAHR
ncbi:MAG: pre-peptidase C-terminal domain-containing protein [Pseudomonadota bacterium]